MTAWAWLACVLLWLAAGSAGAFLTWLADEDTHLPSAMALVLLSLGPLGFLCGFFIWCGQRIPENLPTPKELRERRRLARERRDRPSEVVPARRARRGYSPTGPPLDKSRPPQGGSGLPLKPR